MLPIVHLPPEIPAHTPVIQWLASERSWAVPAFFSGEVLVADAGPVISPVVQKQKYDAAFSVCQAVVPTANNDFSIANVLHPVAAVSGYLFEKGTPFDANALKGVTAVEGPTHGKLIPDADFPDSVFVYYPNEDYLGPDQITYVIEVMGSTFKVIVTAWVADVPPESGGCPEGYELPPADTD